MDDYYNQRQPLLQQQGQQYGHIPPPQYNVGPPPQPHVQYPGTIPTYQGGYPAAYPVGLTQQPAPSPPYHGNPTYNNNTHGYYHQPHPPQVVQPMTDGYPSPDPHQSEALPLPPEPPIVHTNFRFSLCLCITWIILLALPAIPLGICAFICSINSKKLQDKKEYEKANKRGSYAMGLNIISFVIGAGWLIVVLIGGPILSLLLLNKYLSSSYNNQY